MKKIINNKEVSPVTTLWEGNYWKASNGSVELSDSIDNYDMLIVAGKMYYSGDLKSGQTVTMTIPKALYYYASQHEASQGNTQFILNGSINNNTRRIYFGFDPASPNFIYTGTIEGTSGNLPRLTGVYGIKF